MKKIILGTFLLLGIVIGIGVFYLVSNLNQLVAEAIETHGSEVTETRVSVTGVEISIREGRGSIEDLRIANPEGFSAGYTFSLGDITLDIDLASVREDPIVIDEILIRAPEINAEFTATGASNIDELRKQIQAHVPESDGGDGGGGSDSAPPKIRIKKLTFEQGRIEVDATALGLENRSLDLPAIRMDDIGGVQGATADQIATIVLSRLAKDAASKIASSEVNRLIEDNLGDEAKGLLDKLRN